jgi:hypothetical protein
MANTSAQGLRQQTVETSTGTALSYEGDWLALFNAASINANGGFNGRLLAWINAQLSTSYDNVNNAMQAFAVARGTPGGQATPINWSSMGTFTIGGAAAPSDPVPIIF